MYELNFNYYHHYTIQSFLTFHTITNYRTNVLKRDSNRFVQPVVIYCLAKSEREKQKHEEQQRERRKNSIYLFKNDKLDTSLLM